MPIIRCCKAQNIGLYFIREEKRTVLMRYESKIFIGNYLRTANDFFLLQFCYNNALVLCNCLRHQPAVRCGLKYLHCVLMLSPARHFKIRIIQNICYPIKWNYILNIIDKYNEYDLIFLWATNHCHLPSYSPCNGLVQPVCGP